MNQTQTLNQNTTTSLPRSLPFSNLHPLAASCQPQSYRRLSPIWVKWASCRMPVGKSALISQEIYLLLTHLFTDFYLSTTPLLIYSSVAPPRLPPASPLHALSAFTMNGRQDVQFLSVNHNKFVAYPPENKTAKQMAAPPDKSHPRSKHTFDLLSISDQLPPNTGPAGTVPVNGSNSSSNSNKNLSHVPCKFHRQGICQAGNLCPFSHNLDGTLAADKLPCKYFQKGNCKFGLKCALAHFLPDGTRVNSKSLLSYRRNNDRNSERNSERNADRERGDRSERDRDRHDRDRDRERNSYFSGYTDTSHKRSPSISSVAAATPVMSFGPQSSTSASTSTSHSPVSQPIDISVNTLLKSRNGSGGLGNAPLSASYATFTPSLASSHTNAQASSFRMSANNYIALGAGSSLANYGGSDWLVNGLTAVNGGQASSYNSTLMSNPFNTGIHMTSNPMRRSLSSNSPPNFSMASPASGDFGREYRPSSSEFSTGTSAFQSPQAQFSAPYSKFTRSIPESTSPQFNFNRIGSDSAVLDDDSEEHFGEDDNGFFEDYVPASLGNLILTPQERQRRNSRSQSGTLLVRPNMLSAMSFDKRTDRKLPSGDDVFLMD